jgi:hypothetical protein
MACPFAKLAWARFDRVSRRPGGIDQIMKWLLVLGVLLLVLLLVAVKFRRQIMAGWQIWMMLRKLRKAGKAQEPAKSKPDNLKEVPLVRCEKCGKWISPETALKFRQGKHYCSSQCMERAAKLQSLVD